MRKHSADGKSFVNMEWNFCLDHTKDQLLINITNQGHSHVAWKGQQADTKYQQKLTISYTVHKASGNHFLIKVYNSKYQNL
jgi:hypothetical protein